MKRGGDDAIDGNEGWMEEIMQKHEEEIGELKHQLKQVLEKQAQYEELLHHHQQKQGRKKLKREIFSLLAEMGFEDKQLILQKLKEKDLSHFESNPIPFYPISQHSIQPFIVLSIQYCDVGDIVENTPRFSVCMTEYILYTHSRFPFLLGNVVDIVLDLLYIFLGDMFLPITMNLFPWR